MFGHDTKWGRLATQSAQPMVSVFMRKLGDTDITTLTDFDKREFKESGTIVGTSLIFLTKKPKVGEQMPLF